MSLTRKIDYLNFDSLYSVDALNDCFDSTFILMHKYTNIKKIYLKNAEIPIGFPNIRSSNFSNVLSFILNGITYNPSITQQNYSTISSLISALNASILTAISGSGFTLILSVSLGNNIIITTTGAFTSYSINQNTLSNILGLSSALNQIAGTYTSPYIFNLGYDTYIQMSFNNIPSIFSTLGNVPSAVKIPMNTNAYNILFYSTDRGYYDQGLTVSDSSFILNSMRIIMYDRFGYPLNNGNLEYSFTLGVEYE